MLLRLKILPMSPWLSVLLEIIKLTVPALIVFLTVTYMLKQFFGGQLQLKALEIQEQQNKTTLPLKLQAYERLSLFCERISVPNLLLRLGNNGGQPQGLKVALLMAIQQEFEHNITQQVYVSEQLWAIIKAARDDNVNFIDLVWNKLEGDFTASDFRQALFAYQAQREHTGLDTALSAIKKEASVILG